MAHKITDLFKKKRTFPKFGNEVSGNEIKELFSDLNQRLVKVESTLEELVNKK